MADESSRRKHNSADAVEYQVNNARITTMDTDAYEGCTSEGNEQSELEKETTTIRKVSSSIREIQSSLEGLRGHVASFSSICTASERMIDNWMRTLADAKKTYKPPTEVVVDDQDENINAENTEPIAPKPTKPAKPLATRRTRRRLDVK